MLKLNLALDSAPIPCAFFLAQGRKAQPPTQARMPAKPRLTHRRWLPHRRCQV